MRYLAPEHVSSIFISSGEVKVEDGVAVLPDDAPSYDHQALQSVGCIADASDTEKQPKLELERPAAVVSEKETDA